MENIALAADLGGTYLRLAAISEEVGDDARILGAARLAFDNF